MSGLAETEIRKLYNTAYLQGYDFAIDIIRQCVSKKTHANPAVARVLNEAFTILARELTASRAILEGSLNANPLQPPI